MNMNEIIKVRAVAYPLDEIDTYSELPGKKLKGALELIVNQTEHQGPFGYEINNSLPLLDETPINQLLQEKWNKFAKFWFYAWTIAYMVFLAIFNISILAPRGTAARDICSVLTLIGTIPPPPYGIRLLFFLSKLSEPLLRGRDYSGL